jgi:hypothetical protein
MAGKLTIRRVGHFLPALCLVAGLLLIAVTTWLCTAGLPSCALRYIEEEAARAGLPLTVEKIKLSPSSGLAVKAEGLQLHLEQPDAAPAQVYFRKIKVAFSLTRLLSGQYMPLNAAAKGGRVAIPLSKEAGDSLQLEALDIYTTFSGDGGIPAPNDEIRNFCSIFTIVHTICLLFSLFYVIIGITYAPIIHNIRSL